MKTKLVYYCICNAITKFNIFFVQYLCWNFEKCQQHWLSALHFGCHSDKVVLYLEVEGDYTGETYDTELSWYT